MDIRLIVAISMIAALPISIYITLYIPSSGCAPISSTPDVGFWVAMLIGFVFLATPLGLAIRKYNEEKREEEKEAE